MTLKEVTKLQSCQIIRPFISIRSIRRSHSYQSIGIPFGPETSNRAQIFFRSRTLHLPTAAPLGRGHFHQVETGCADGVLAAEGCLDKTGLRCKMSVLKKEPLGGCLGEFVGDEIVTTQF